VIAAVPRRLVGVGLLIGWLLNGCAAPPGAVDHPLTGRIVDHHAREVAGEKLFQALAQAEVVYLGEKHDNAVHHAHQLTVLRELVARGRRPALGLEMVSAPETSTLMRYAAQSENPHAGASPEQQLRGALGWPDTEDWRWRAYGPLLEFARAESLAVFGADLPVSLRRRIAVAGIDGLSGVERARLPDTPPPDDAYAELMRTRIREAHCGYGSEEYLDRLLANWVVRNERMARTIAATLAAGDGEPVVLVVGGAHLRHNLGVPARVQRLRPGVRQLNLGLREVDPAHVDAHGYVAELEFAGTRFAPDHDYFWFTAPSPEPEPDPCAVFKKKGHTTSG
jgi:uncharacterized iron-regulated protein